MARPCSLESRFGTEYASQNQPMRSTGESPVDERPSVAPSLWSLSLHADTLSPIPLGDWIMVQENFVPLHGQPAQPGIAERWEQVRFQLRKHWPQLSNEDLSAIDGDSRKLIALVHQKTGADIREIESQIDTIAASSEGLLDRVNRTIQQAVASASKVTLFILFPWLINVNKLRIQNEF